MLGLNNIFEKRRKAGLGQKACDAALRGDFVLALEYVGQGADVNYIGRTTTYSESKIDISVAHQAIRQGSTKALEALLERGLDVNLTLKENRQSLLVEALESGHDDAVRLLINRGANLNVTNPALQTPLDLARKKGMDDVARLIGEKLQPQAQAAAAEAVTLAADTPAMKPLVLNKRSLKL